MKIIWVDLLCFSSLIKLIWLNRKYRIEKIYYISIAQSLSPFFRILEKAISPTFLQINTIVESEERLNNVTLYEFNQRRITDILENWIKKPVMVVRNKNFCDRYGFNIDKYNAHLKEAAYYYLFRPIEISVLAQKISGERDVIFLFRKTPFCQLLKEELGRDRTCFYFTIHIPCLKVEERDDYHYDVLIKKKYYAGCMRAVLKVFLLWFVDSLSGVVSFFVNKLQRDGNDLYKGHTNIGIELTQKRIRLDEINDIFWLNGSGINTNTVCGIELEDLDSQSIRLLHDMGIKSVKNKRNQVKLICNQILDYCNNVRCNIAFPNKTYFLRTLPSIPFLLISLASWDENGWLYFQQVVFINRTLFWQSVYKKLGIKILWTMYDVDVDKLSKAQAMENLGGLYIGGHWSNMILYKSDNHKCFDVLFTWGEHFINNNFNRYPFMEIFQTGYPSDHYFEMRRSRATSLRNQYAGKFILSYQDNIMANDLPFSKNMQIKVHEMLISILKEYDDVVVFLKPKREYVFNTVLKDVSELREFIDKGRIVTFFGETNRTKAVPAEIGMASDLVVGLGISTTAAECQFAGTLGFHADLTGFRNNGFGNMGLGKVVFRDITTLKDAIIDVIENGATKKYMEYKELYSTLDPFQDGKAYRRMGFVINNFQDLLNRGLSREDTISITREKYDKFIKETYKDKILC